MKKLDPIGEKILRILRNAEGFTTTEPEITRYIGWAPRRVIRNRLVTLVDSGLVAMEPFDATDLRITEAGKAYLAGVA